MKHDLEDEWIIHAIGRSQWPSPPEALYHKIAVQTRGGRVPFVRLVSQKQIYAGFIFLMTMAFIVGGCVTAHPRSLLRLLFMRAILVMNGSTSWGEMYE